MTSPFPTSPTAAVASPADMAPDAMPDPMPEPPPAPDFESCCGNGCDPCIYDLHDLAMDQYRQALRAWRARHPEAGQGQDAGAPAA